MFDGNFIPSVRPGEYARLKGWPFSLRYKIIVSAKGVRLKKARWIEAWGAVLGANMSHTFKNGDQVKLLGFPFTVIGDDSGTSCEFQPVETELYPSNEE